jgi:hypothetical protein
MNSEWQTPKSNIRIALGVAFIIAGFVWLVYFGNYMLTAYRYSTPDKFIVWLGLMTFSLLLWIAFYIGFSIKTRKAVLGFLSILIWSIGLLLIPVPEGYGEAVLGSYFLLFILLMALYAKHEESKRKKARQNC